MDRFGFIRVAAATPVVAVADTKTNTQRICSLIEKGVSEKVSLLVFPELSITGATCGDLFFQDLLVREAREAIDGIASFCEGLPITVVVGAPVMIDGRTANCSLVINDGEVLSVVPKGENAVFDIDGARFSFYPCSQSRIVIMPSADADDIATKETVRRNTIAASSMDACAYVYSNAGWGESTTDNVYSGYSLITENGNVIAEGEEFLTESHLTIADIDTQLIDCLRSKDDFSEDEQYDVCQCLACPDPNYDRKFYRPLNAMPFIPDADGLEQAAKIQAAGLATRLSNINCHKVVLGISGGLDSTLALLCAIRSFEMLELDPKGIIAITMPGFGTSKRTHGNAGILMSELGVTAREIDITQACRKHLKDIGHDGTTQDVTYENAQARERTQILMDVANAENALVVGTGDLSELALGWCTYGGDHISNYSVNASIPKTLVRAMVAHEADTKYAGTKICGILHDIIDTPVSPELKGRGNGIEQKTEDIIGPYELHDFFIWNIIQFGFSPEKVIFLAQKSFKGRFSKKEITDCMKVFIKRFFRGQFKRSCSPDGPKVTAVSLSPRGGWSMPSDISAKLFNDNIN